MESVRDTAMKAKEFSKRVDLLKSHETWQIKNLVKMKVATRNKRERKTEREDQMGWLQSGIVRHFGRSLLRNELTTKKSLSRFRKR